MGKEEGVKRRRGRASRTFVNRSALLREKTGRRGEVPRKNRTELPILTSCPHKTKKRKKKGNTSLIFFSD